MNDLISREALKKAIDEFHQEEKARLHNPLWRSIDLDALNRLIDNVPAVEERPTGHWEKTGPNMYHCSHCGAVDSISFANFCWLCGADMRGIVTGREEINTEQLNGKEKKTLAEAFFEDINTDEVDYNELCYRTGHHMTMCDCELCDHKHECSGYEGDDDE